MTQALVLLAFWWSSPLAAQEILTNAEVPFQSEDQGATGSQNQKVSNTYREMNSSISDSLQEFPALSVQQSLNQNHFVYLQGGGSGQTGVYLDGLLWNDPSSPDQVADLFGLSSFNIESVSVYPGPQGGSWGTEGLSGVVSFKSRPIVKDLNRITARAGERGFFHFGLQSATASKSSGTSFYFESRKADGYSAAAESLGNSEVDGYDTQSLFIKHQKRFRQVKIDSQFMIQQGRQEFDDRGGPGGDDPTYDVEKEMYSAGGTFSLPINSRFAADLKVQGSQVIRNYKDAMDSPTDILLDEKYLGDRQFVQLAGSNPLAANGEKGGIDFKREGMQSKGFSRERNTTGYFIENKNGSVRIETSREDSVADYSLRANPEFQIHSQGVYLSLGSSWASRRASLGQLYDPQYGNENLLTERLYYRQVGLKYKPRKDAQLQWSWFQSDYTNLVQWDFATSKLSNVGEARISGNEVLASVTSGKTQVNLGLSLFNELVDLKKETALLRRPKSKSTLGLETSVSDAWKVSSQAQWVSERKDIDPLTFAETTLSEYWLIDASIQWSFEKDSNVFLQFKNIFDTQYETASGYGSEPMSIYLGTQIQL